MKHDNKKKSLIIAGVFLAYYGLKDFEDFNVLYNGIALVASITAFVLAYIESSKEKTE